jgi:hypothetical protein
MISTWCLSRAPVYGIRSVLRRPDPKVFSAAHDVAAESQIQSGRERRAENHAGVCAARRSRRLAERLYAPWSTLPGQPKPPGACSERRLIARRFLDVSSAPFADLGSLEVPADWLLGSALRASAPISLLAPHKARRPIHLSGQGYICKFCTPEIGEHRSMVDRIRIRNRQTNTWAKYVPKSRRETLSNGTACGAGNSGRASLVHYPRACCRP